MSRGKEVYPSREFEESAVRTLRRFLGNWAPLGLHSQTIHSNPIRVTAIRVQHVAI